MSSIDELVGYLMLMKKRPSILCLNETFLDKSIGDVVIEGYTLASRLDLKDGRQCGGIASCDCHRIRFDSLDKDKFVHRIYSEFSIFNASVGRLA